IINNSNLNKSDLDKSLEKLRKINQSESFSEGYNIKDSKLYLDKTANLLNKSRIYKRLNKICSSISKFETYTGSIEKSPDLEEKDLKELNKKLKTKMQTNIVSLKLTHNRAKNKKLNNRNGQKKQTNNHQRVLTDKIENLGTSNKTTKDIELQGFENFEDNRNI
ncbi:21335_t:CDS:2, partial [Dentiscutata erythropus]